jgi:hypothetical protein
VITPTSFVSTSLSPTLSVPGGTGAWTFTLSDLSDGKSAFGTKTYAETGNSTRVPTGAGLQQGNVYTWKATSAGQNAVGGSFMVDLQMSEVQQFDSGGGVNIACVVIAFDGCAPGISWLWFAIPTIESR